jgi:hypothetical protein
MSGSRAVLIVAAALVVAAAAGALTWRGHQKRVQEQADTGLIAEATEELRRALGGTPSQDAVALVESYVDGVKASRNAAFAEDAELYLLSTREIVRLRAAAAALAREAAANRQALAAHLAHAGRRDPAWFRDASELKRRVERNHSDLDRTLRALDQVLEAMPEAEKRLAPHVQPALLPDAAELAEARKRAQADAQRAAGELEKLRRLVP